MHRWSMRSTNNRQKGAQGSPACLSPEPGRAGLRGRGSGQKRTNQQTKNGLAHSRDGLLCSLPGWGLGAGRSRKRADMTWRRGAYRGIGWCLTMAVMWVASSVVHAADREPVTLSVVVVNPSQEKTQSTPVRIDLPQEVSPADVLDRGELSIEYDDDRAIYYVAKDSVELKPSETRVFAVTLKDKWFIPDEQLGSLESYTKLLLERLKDTTYYESASQLAATIVKQLGDIKAVQSDDSLSRKSRIGAYRINVQTIDKIQEDLARMEKLLTFVGGPPVPEMLEESPLKSDAPSTTTTWLVIFLIVVFMGLLAGQFFFTWQRRVKTNASDLAHQQEASFPKQESVHSAATNGGR